MSPEHGKKRCVILLADGSRSDVFEYLLERGKLKNISRHIVEPGAFITAASVFPSTTGPAYTPYLTGNFPGKCGVPGIRWLDRDLWDKPFTFRRMRSYVSYEAMFLNNDMTTHPPLLFELIPSSVSVFNEMNRGLLPGNNLTKSSSAFWKLKSHFFKNGSSIDRAAADKLLDRLDSSVEDLPLFCFAVFMEIDSLSHKLHPFHKKVVDAYIKLDGIVGEVVERLEKKGVLDNTLFLIVSDHGMTATHTHLDLSAILKDKGFKLLEYPNIFRNFFGADCSVMVSGNSMAHIYFRNACGETKKSVANCLASRREIDIVMRKETCGWISITSSRGSGRVKVRGDKIFYETAEGDPFGFPPMKSEISKDEQLSLTFETGYPDALLQVCQICESSRAGDIIVSAKAGFDLRSRFEFPEHRASHGSISGSHTRVPVMMNIKIGGGKARTVDIYPTVLDHMGIETPENIDGKSLLARRG